MAIKFTPNLTEAESRPLDERPVLKLAVNEYIYSYGMEPLRIAKASDKQIVEVHFGRLEEPAASVSALLIYCPASKNLLISNQGSFSERELLSNDDDDDEWPHLNSETLAEYLPRSFPSELYGAVIAPASDFFDSEFGAGESIFFVLGLKPENIGHILIHPKHRSIVEVDPEDGSFSVFTLRTDEDRWVNVTAASHDYEQKGD